MALTITTADAEALLKGILNRLGQGAVEGWESHGESFTLTSPEWGRKAWVRAFPEPGRLVLGLVPYTWFSPNTGNVRYGYPLDFQQTPPGYRWDAWLSTNLQPELVYQTNSVETHPILEEAGCEEVG